MQSSVICTLKNINRKLTLEMANTYSLRLRDKAPIDQRLRIIRVGSNVENIVCRRGTDVAIIGLVESSSFNHSNTD